MSIDDGYEKTYGTDGTTDAIGLAFEGGAVTAICCRVGNGGTQGNVKLKLEGGSVDAVSITTKYVGSKAFTVSIKDKLSDDSMRECIIYAGTKEFEKVAFAKMAVMKSLLWWKRSLVLRTSRLQKSAAQQGNWRQLPRLQ